MPMRRRKKISGADGIDDRLHTAVSAAAAAAAQSQPPRRQIEIVIDHDQLPRPEMVTAHQLRHRPPAQIHEGARLGEKNPP